jgi:ferritin-like metal-binding protein YciE
MAETAQVRINRYIEDAIAAERNFEDALHSFGETGVQERLKQLLAKAGDRARTQHERLTRLLEKRGGKPSEAKSVLAHMLAFSPLTAQIGHDPAEKNTQHLIVTYGAAAAETAMYESLAAAAEQTGDTDVVALARQLQSEERDDAEQVWPLLQPSATDAFQREVAMGKAPDQILRAYLEDIIAAEKTFETQLTGFSKEGNDPAAHRAFAQHAEETRRQYERLTQRLESGFGGSPSITRSMVAHVFGVAPKVAQLGHDGSERLTQNLMMGFAVENAEVAIYEVFATVAAMSGDKQTENLAREIQQQERETAQKVWNLLAPAARRSIAEVDIAKAS